MNNDGFPDDSAFNESMGDSRVSPVNFSQNSLSSPTDSSDLPPQTIPYENAKLFANQLIALSHSTLDATNLVNQIPELPSIAKKIAFYEFIDSLIVSCNEEIKKVWWNPFFYWFLIGVIGYFNSQSIKFLYISTDRWGIPGWESVIVAFGMIWLIDFAIKTLISSELKVKFADDQKKALSKRLFNDPDHPLQTIYDRHVVLCYEEFIQPFKNYNFKWLLFTLLGFILVGEASVTLFLLNQAKNGIPFYLALTPLLSGSLNILSGIYAGMTMEYPKQLSALKGKLERAKQQPFI